MWNKIAALLVLTVLVGCSSNQPVQDPESNQADVVEEYHIGVGDSLSINVWRNKELSISVPVRPDGKISMPLIGDVQAAGRSAEGLADGITDELKTFVRNPQVSVIVMNPSSTDFQRRVRITGAVRQPMSVAHRDGMTVLDIVLLAGGLNDFASANSAKLYRKVAGKIEVYPLKLSDILNDGELATNFTLLPSDIITVPERIF